MKKPLFKKTILASLRTQVGMTIVEVLIASAIAVVAFVSAGSTIGYYYQSSKRNTFTESLSIIRNNLYAAIINDASWELMKNVNSDMACLQSGTALTACPNAIPVGTPVPITATQIKVLDSVGALLYDPTSATSGYDLRGNPCNAYDATNGNDACPIRVNVSWGPADCAAASCPIPELVNVSIRFFYKPSTSNQQMAANVTRLNVNLLRSRAGAVAGYVVGTCGTANNSPAYSIPIIGLCTLGTPTAVAGAGPWTWTCLGAGGAPNASCSTTLKVDCVGGWLPAVCPVTCGGTALNATQTYAITTPASNGGLACPYLTGNTQICNPMACAVSGVCGTATAAAASAVAPVVNLCSAGTPSAVVANDVTGTFMWDCLGTTGGTNATGCTAPKIVDCVSNNWGACSLPCGGGVQTFAITQPALNGGVACLAANGATQACNTSACLSNGVCGLDNGITTATPPVNLCTSGAASVPVAAANTYTWTCAGVSGGTTASCSANQIVNGTCGTAAVPTPIPVPSPGPTTNLCATGTASAVALNPVPTPNTWDWACNGANTGTNSSCSVPLNSPTTCYTPPSYGGCANHNVCATICGASYSYTSCYTSGSSYGDICTAGGPVNGACGTANGVATSTAPATNLCSAGASSAVTGTGPWSWSCAGSGGGTTAACSASLPSAYYAVAVPFPRRSSGWIDIGYSDCVSFSIGAGTACMGPPVCYIVGSGNLLACSNAPGPSITGVCGTANNVLSATQPLLNLCAVGSVMGNRPNDHSLGRWYWYCWPSGGIPVECSAP